jgi:hypothetical protein
MTFPKHVLAIVMVVAAAGLSRAGSETPQKRSGAAAAEITLERFWPSQLPRGESTVIRVAAKDLDGIEAVEINPSPGVKLLTTRETDPAQGLKWWEITLSVDAEAETGERTLVIVTPRGRTAPKKILIPSHLPTISNLSIVSTKPDRATIEVSLAAYDELNDLGKPVEVVWTLSCGSQWASGFANGTASGKGSHKSVVTATLQQNPGTSAYGACDFEVHIQDSLGIESNRLKATVEFKN